jgi:hypothetical protein
VARSCGLEILDGLVAPLKNKKKKGVSMLRSINRQLLRS